MKKAKENLDETTTTAKKPKLRIRPASPFIVQHVPVSLTINPPVVSEGGTATVTVTYISGKAPDFIFINPLNAPAGLITSNLYGQPVIGTTSTFTLTIGTLSAGAVIEDIQIYVSALGGGIIGTLRIFKRNTPPPAPVLQQLSTINHVLLQNIVSQT